MHRVWHRRESVDQALLEYQDLFSRVAAEARRLGLGRPPKQLMLWISERPMAGSSISDGSFPAWIDEAFLSRLRASTDATLVDASYAHLPVHQRAPLPVDKCRDKCAAAAEERVCNVNQARADVCGDDAALQREKIVLERTLDAEFCAAPAAPAASLAGGERASAKALCPRRCTAVRGRYYTPSEAHVLAAQALLPPLQVVLGSLV